MGINIESERAHQLAQQLAEAKGLSLSAAVEQALELAVDKVREEREAADRLRQLREQMGSGRSADMSTQHDGKYLSRVDLLASIRQARGDAPGITMEEAVARIRELRDEWEH